MTTNPYQSPQAATEPGGPNRWPYLGWLAPVITWMPALLLLGLAVPNFFEIFHQLQETGELPGLSSWVMAAARISRSLFHLPIALFLAGLIAMDVTVNKFAQAKEASWPRILWQTTICACGMVAATAIMIGLLLPIIH